MAYAPLSIHSVYSALRDELAGFFLEYERKGHAAQVEALEPILYLVGLHGVEHIAKLVNLLVGIVVFAYAPIGIEFLVVEVFDLLSQGAYHLLLFAHLVRAAALAVLQLLHAVLVLFACGDLQRDARTLGFFGGAVGHLLATAGLGNKVDDAQVGEVESYNYGAPVTIREKYVKEGYTVSDWDRTAGFNMPAENIVITATSSINQYTIIFDTAGGSEIAPITQNYGTAVTAPADPTKTGYKFERWNPAVPATMPAENITCTAQWTVSPAPALYTVSYDLNNCTGGTAPASLTQTTAGESLTVAAVPDGLTAPEGKVLAGGWNTAAEGTGTNYAEGSSITPTADITLYVKLADVTPVTYTVTFDGNKPAGASGTVTGVPDPITGVVSGTTITQPKPDPALTGYTFGGWYKEPECTTACVFETDTVTSDFTLYAKGTKKEEPVGDKDTVTFDVQGKGTAPEAIANVVLPAKKPVIAGESNLCAGCGVAALSIDYYDLGVATGKMAVKILKDGADISTMPIEYAPQEIAYFNPSVCEALGLTPLAGYIAIE